MHYLLAVVFDEEAKANEGKLALLQWEAEGGVIIHGYALLAKRSDGSVTVSYEDEHRPFFTFPGTSECDNAPSGEASGLAAVAVVSLPVPTPWDNSRICSFIEDMRKVMLPDRVILVADIEDEWPIATDRRMGSRGGIVFRRILED